jgi:CHASE2 domain-containing sensor protein
MFWLRLSFWLAAIADILVAIMVLIPDLPGDTYVISMGQMSAVAFSWGIMLIMAAIKPMARRWIAIPTMLVVFLLGVVSVHALVTGLLPTAMLIPALATSVVVFTLLIIGYLKTRNHTSGQV